MFSKLKSKKVSISSVSNQLRLSSIADLSPAELQLKSLKIAVGDQLGIPSNSIVTVAYDPVQLLLAVCTNDNAVRVYGQHTVEVVFELKTSGDIDYLRFVKGVYLVCLQVSGSITVLSLYSKQVLGTYNAPGSISAVGGDPALDFIVLGLVNGSILFYDVDRLALTPLRIDNLQKKVLPRQKMSPVLSVRWHPRDLGVLLVAYSHCAVQYSLATGLIKNSFVYTLTKDQAGFEYSFAVETGGKKRVFGSSKEVTPQCVEAHYHPNGLHIVTVHADGTLVFWDANTATLLEARTVAQTGMHRTGPPLSMDPEGAPTCIRAKWITDQDPEISELIVTGADKALPETVYVLDFDYALKYSMTSYEKQADFYIKPQGGIRKFTVRFNRRKKDGEQEAITQIIPIPADLQPYFDGGHNPSGFMFVSNSSALYFNSFLRQNGTPPFDFYLPPSLSKVVPPITFFEIYSVRRIEWFGILSSKRTGAPTGKVLLIGGAPQNRNLPRAVGHDDNFHSISISGHESGIVRLFDVSSVEHHGDEKLVQINLKDTLNTGGDLSSYKVTMVSCSFENREMIVGLGNGNVAICKFARLQHSPIGAKPARTGYDNCPVLHANGDARIVSLMSRLLGYFSSNTFSPVYLVVLDGAQKISALKMCNAGFAAVAYESGKLIVCDVTRGPAVILNLESISRYVPSAGPDCFATTIEFSIMEYGQDGYSSLIMLVGTNKGGNLLMFKIVPQPNGGFSAEYMDKLIGLVYKHSGEGGAIEKIMPIDATTGNSAVATLESFQRLGQGKAIPGLVAVGMKRDLRVVKLPKQKVSHKTVDETCVCFGVVRFRDRGHVLGAVTRSGSVKLFLLPNLSELASVKIPSETFSKIERAMNKIAAGSSVLGSTILPTGDILVSLNATEHFNLLLHEVNPKNNRVKDEPLVTDLLFNDTAVIPPRPTAGAMLWAKGQATYIALKDLIFLIAGPNRRPVKNEESSLAFNISPEANPNSSYGAYGPAQGLKKETPAYEAPVRKAGPANPYAIATGSNLMQSMRDQWDAVEENINLYANGFSESMTETMEDQKKSFYSLALKSKLGF